MFMFKKVILEKLVNNVLYFLANKSITFKSSLIIFLSSLIFIVGFFVFIKPLHAILRFNKLKLKQLYNLKKICSQSYGDCLDLSKKIEHLNTKIERKLNIIGNASAYRSLSRVIDCISGNSIKLVNYSPGKVEKVNTNSKENLNMNDINEAYSAKMDENAIPNKANKSEFGKKVSFELMLEGMFLNMLNFFKCLSAVKYCLKYNQIYLNKNEQGLIGYKIVIEILQVSK